MSGVKHTSGPWLVIGPDPAIKNPNGGYWEVEGDTNVCAYCTLADARLIAAAPELLEAARFAVEYDELLQSYKGPAVLFDGDVAEIDAAYDRWIAASRAALAKAQGNG